MSMTPRLGAVGEYVLLAPFTVSPGDSYKCTNVRSLSSVVLSDQAEESVAHSDVFVVGAPTAAITYEQLTAGTLINVVTGTNISTFTDITGNVEDEFGNTLLTLQQFDAGLLYVSRYTGVDSAWTTVYAENGLSAGAFATDLTNDVTLVTLTGVNVAREVVVPSSYIIGVPVVDTVPYSDVVISVGLGPLPDGVSLENVLLAINNYVTDVTGLPADVKVHTVPSSGTVSQQQHAILESNRLAAITHRQSAHAQLQALNMVTTGQANYIAALEAALTGQ